MFLTLFLGYLCGSLSSAVLVSRLLGLPDPRHHGSHNPGATNVLRLGGKRAALLTLLGDILKGILPAGLLKLLFPSHDAWWLACGFGAFLGHLWPLFFRFQGGKGVATAVGVLMVWDFRVALFAFVVWGVVFFWTRISSLSALTAAFCTPIFAFILIDNKKIPIVILAMVALLIYRHRDNIARLKNGQEQSFRAPK